MSAAAGSLGSPLAEPPEVRAPTRQDISNALRRGVEDFSAFRTDVLFVVAIYPIIGLCLAAIAFDAARLPMLFPLAPGFALLGPLAAIGLYKMSRQREAGLTQGWGAALAALRANILGPAMVLGLILLGLFLAWMFAAGLICKLTLGPAPPLSADAFLADVLGTSTGWAMIVPGVGVGAGF